MLIIPEPGDRVICKNGERFTVCTRQHVYSVHPEQKKRDEEWVNWPGEKPRPPAWKGQNVDFIYGFNSKGLLGSWHPNPRSVNYFPLHSDPGWEIAEVIPDMTKSNNKRLKEMLSV